MKGERGGEVKVIEEGKSKDIFLLGSYTISLPCGVCVYVLSYADGFERGENTTMMRSANTWTNLTGGRTVCMSSLRCKVH